jgi:hypothetical protein
MGPAGLCPLTPAMLHRNPPLRQIAPKPWPARNANLEAALRRRSCKNDRYAPVYMIRLTAAHEIMPYQLVHPDGECRAS